MPFRVVKFFEVAGNGFEFSYQPGQVLSGERIDTERLVRNGFLEVFGEEAADRKESVADVPRETDTPKRKRGRPRKNEQRSVMV